MNLCYLSVLHPGSKPYFHDFINSLCNQSDKNFTLYLGLDNCKCSILETDLPFRLVCKDVSGIPIIDNRYALIQEILEIGFEYLIFGDSDDLVSENKVEKTKEILAGKSNTLLINENSLIDQNGHIIKEKYYSNRSTDPIRDFEIDFYNYIGMSNTAMTLKTISLPPKPPASMQILDWYFFTWLILNNWETCWNSEIITYYRQHHINTGIGENDPLNFQNTIKQRDIHYRALRSLNPTKYDRLIEMNLNSLNSEPNNKNALWFENPPIKQSRA